MPARAAAGGRPRRLALVLLVGSGLISFSLLGTVPHDALHPLALMAALLPLQLAGLLWAVLHQR